jgi:hypothetical protein
MVPNDQVLIKVVVVIVSSPETLHLSKSVRPND